MDVTKPTESDHLLLPSLLPVDVQSDLLQEEEENTKTALSDSNSADTNNTSEAGTETVTDTELRFDSATHHGLYGSGDDMIPQCLLSVGFLCHQVPGPILKSASSLTSSCSSFSISGCFLWSSLSWSPFYCIKASPYSSPPFLCPFSINTAL